MDHNAASNQASPFLATARSGAGGPPTSGLTFGGPSSRASSSSHPFPPPLQHSGFSSFGVPSQASASNSSQQQQQQQQQQPCGVGPAAWAYANAQLNSYAAAQRQRQPTGGDHTINSNAAAAYYAPSPSSRQASSNSSLSSPVMNGAGGGAGGSSAFASTHLSQLPPGVADLNSLNIHSTASSTPASAASSPGWQHRRLPSAGGGGGGGTIVHTVGGGSARESSISEHNAPSHNPRVAASSVTGKRLNWGEMICATIAHSEHGRLVIQDLFEQMCARFPEVQEWAFGKDWEARVKNRIKSTLSIKGHLFVKVPRPSSAAGKGSWWTLSQEAQDAYHEGRLGPLLKLSGTTPAGSASASHSRGGSVSENLTMTSTDSQYNSPGPSTGGSTGGTGSTPGVATPLKQHAVPHPLAQHMEAASASPNPTPTTALASGEHSQQAQQARQLAELQAHLLRQQQAQREVLPGSYDPNAPPSGSAYFPHQFYGFDGLGASGGAGTPGAILMSGQSQNASGTGVSKGGSGDADTLFSSSMQSIYGASFGNHMSHGGMPMPPGRFGGSGQAMGDMDKMGTSYGDTPMMPASFESGSFGATLKALGGMTPWKGAGIEFRMTPGRPGEGSANDSGVGESNPSGTSASASDSIDSASASSSSAPTGTGSSTGPSSWGMGTSSWGVGSPQSIPHLGGPQSMPFPANPAATGRDVPPSSARTSATGPAGGGSHRPESSDGSTIGNPFDFSSSASFSHGSSAVNGLPGPGGMYPYSLSSLGEDAEGTKGNTAVPPNIYRNGVGGGPVYFTGGAGPHPHHHHHHHGAGNNPFGMSIPGGYAMPSPVSANSPYHATSAQPRLNFLNTPMGTVPPTDSHDSGSAGGGVEGGAADGSASAATTVPPSPADSTSAFFAFTPAAGPIDGAFPSSSSPSRPGSGSGGGANKDEGPEGSGPSAEEGSALGPLIGKRKVNSAAREAPMVPLTSGAVERAGTGTGTVNGREPSSSKSESKMKNIPASPLPIQLQKVEEGFALPPPATER